MAEKKLSNMDDEEFMDKWTTAAEQLEAAKARVREFSAEHQKRERFKMLNLEPGDIALLQSMSPEAIESAEAVMTGEDKK